MIIFPLLILISGMFFLIDYFQAQIFFLFLAMIETLSRYYTYDKLEPIIGYNHLPTFGRGKSLEIFYHYFFFSHFKIEIFTK